MTRKPVTSQVLSSIPYWSHMVRVVDMDSTNGTFIGGARVSQGGAGAKNAMQMANYDVLKVGGHTLSVTY